MNQQVVMNLALFLKKANAYKSSYKDSIISIENILKTKPLSLEDNNKLENHKQKLILEIENIDLELNKLKQGAAADLYLIAEEIEKFF